jgi:hypothetical protein
MTSSNQPKWTELDTADLREGFRENLSVADIAGRLFRTEADVAEQALESGVRLRRTRPD